MQIEIERPVSAIKSSSLIHWDFTGVCGYCSGRYITTNGLNLAGACWRVLLYIRQTIAPSGGDWLKGEISKQQKGLRDTEEEYPKKG